MSAYQAPQKIYGGISYSELANAFRNAVTQMAQPSAAPGILNIINPKSLLPGYYSIGSPFVLNDDWILFTAQGPNGWELWIGEFDGMEIKKPRRLATPSDVGSDIVTAHAVPDLINEVWAVYVTGPSNAKLLILDGSMNLTAIKPVTLQDLNGNPMTPSARPLGISPVLRSDNTALAAVSANTSTGLYVSHIFASYDFVNSIQHGPGDGFLALPTGGVQAQLANVGYGNNEGPRQITDIDGMLVALISESYYSWDNGPMGYSISINFGPDTNYDYTYHLFPGFLKRREMISMPGYSLVFPHLYKRRGKYYLLFTRYKTPLTDNPDNYYKPAIERELVVTEIDRDLLDPHTADVLVRDTIAGEITTMALIPTFGAKYIYIYLSYLPANTPLYITPVIDPNQSLLGAQRSYSVSSATYGYEVQLQNYWPAIRIRVGSPALSSYYYGITLTR